MFGQGVPEGGGSNGEGLVSPCLEFSPGGGRQEVGIG